MTNEATEVARVDQIPCGDIIAIIPLAEYSGEAAFNMEVWDAEEPNSKTAAVLLKVDETCWVLIGRDQAEILIKALQILTRPAPAAAPATAPR
jgi:hypothetical protein